jgi:hypothetical protein
MSEKLIITPKTKVLQVIEAYPELEDVLIGYVPAFKKLKNPILRNTVAKIATLQQAASVGKVKIEDLINLLRKHVGQDLFAENAGSLYNTVKPAWFNATRIEKELDAKVMLAAGEHPVNQVISDLRDLPEGSIYKLIAPFLPAPLIDKATSLGFQHWIVEESEDSYVVYFCKP